MAPQLTCCSPNTSSSATHTLTHTRPPLIHTHLPQVVRGSAADLLLSEHQLLSHRTAHAHGYTRRHLLPVDRELVLAPHLGTGPSVG